MLPDRGSADRRYRCRNMALSPECSSVLTHCGSVSSELSGFVPSHTLTGSIDSLESTAEAVCLVYLSPEDSHSAPLYDILVNDNQDLFKLYSGVLFRLERSFQRPDPERKFLHKPRLHSRESVKGLRAVVERSKITIVLMA